MAKAPDVDYSYRPRGISDAPLIDPGMVAGAAASGWEAAAGVVDMGAAFLKKRAEARAEVEITDALGRSTDELENLRLQLESDPDTANRHEKFRAAAEKVYDAESKKFDYGPTREAYQARFSRLKGSMLTQVKTAAAEEERQVARFKLDDANDDLLNKALFAKAPMERAAYLDTVRQNIEGAVKAGTISGVMGHARLRSGLSRFEVAMADGLIRQNPAMAIKALSNPEEFKHLDAPARARLISQAEQRQRSLAVEASASLTHDLQLYTQARAAGQPVDGKIEEDLKRRSAAVGGAKLQHFETTKRFYDRVDGYAGMSLPELRAASVQLGQGSLEDKQVGRVVDKIIVADTREKSKLLQEGLKEFREIRAAGEQSPKLPELLSLAEEVGGPTLRESVEATDQWYSRVNQAMRGESAVQVRERIAAIEGDRRTQRGGHLALEDIHEIGALQKALEVKEKEAKADPAQYIMKYYPTVAEAFAKAAEAGDAEAFARASEAMIDAQRREGLAPQLLAKPAATRLEEQLTSPNTEERLAAVDAARTAFGQKHWPLVKAQLNRGKDLPPEVDVLASLPPGAVIDRARIVEAFRLKEEEWSKQLGADKGIIDDAIRAQGAEIMRSFNLTPGGPVHADAFMATARRLAYLNRAQGQGSQLAASNAWNEAFNRHWDLVGGVRIPKADGVPLVEPSRLKAAQDVVLRQLDKLDLLDPVAPELSALTPAQRKAQLVRAVRTYGYWVSDKDERGAYLFAGPNQPVRWSDGNPIHLPFESVGSGEYEDVARRLHIEEMRTRPGTHSQFWEGLRARREKR